MRKNRVLIGVLGLALVGTAACSDSSGEGQAAEAAGTTARIKVFAFQPNPIKVPAGTKVTWVNDDDIAHTVTSGKRTYDPADSGKILSTEKDGQFDITLNAAGEKGSFTFDKPGTYHYFCDRHPGMEADVTVS